MTVQAIHHTQLSDRLEALGFVGRRDLYRKKGMTVKIEPGWLTLTTRTSKADSMQRGRAGNLGLWKSVQPVAGRARREFHLPVESIEDNEWCDEWTGEPIDGLAAMIDWARVTADGRLPTGWTSQSRDELERVLPKNGLTIQSGAFVRQGEFHYEDQRLMISFPLIHAVPDELSPARRAWLRSMRVDLQNRCRMVRLARHEMAAGRSGVVAEVDLSGAPRSAQTRLFRMGLDAARHVVARFVGVFELLADPAVTATAWEVAPQRMWPITGENDEC